MLLFLCDITEAYPQSDEELVVVIFFRLPQFGFVPHIVFRVESGLYGLPESGFLWYRTYHGHPTNTFNMTATVHDHCFFVSPSRGKQKSKGHEL